MKFLDVKTDFAFKKVFGSPQSENLLKSFLNSILYNNSTQQITSLVIVDPYSVPQIKGMKETYVDVKAQLNDGSQVIVEMQVLHHPSFEQRILYNATQHYSKQLLVGENYTLLNPVVALTIVDFVLFDNPGADNKPSPHLSRFKLMETQTLTEYSGDIELVFVELPKFKTSNPDLLAMQDQWVYFIKNAGHLSEVPQELAKSNEFKQAFEIINEAGMSAEELEAQYKRREFIAINKGALEQALAKGLAEGEAIGVGKGKAEGVAEATLAIARTLKAQCIDIATIMLATGLTAAELATL